MNTGFLSDIWFGQLAIDAKDYSIIIGMTMWTLYVLFQAIAIRHPNVQDNKVFTLLKLWLYGLPFIGQQFKTIEENQQKKINEIK